MTSITSSHTIEKLRIVFATHGHPHKIVTDNGGKIAKSEYWGLRNLQYKIKKNRKGHYAFLKSDAPAAAVAEMERDLRQESQALAAIGLKFRISGPPAA